MLEVLRSWMANTLEYEDEISFTWKGFVKKELLPPKFEFWEIVPKGSNFEHHFFMKKGKLAHGTILLNVVDFLFHHVACAKTTKDTWDNLCATFERKHVGNILQLCQDLYNLKMEECTWVQVHIDKLLMIANRLTNIDHQVSNEDLTFTLLRSLPPSFHALVVSLSTYTNELSMELVCG